MSDGGPRSRRGRLRWGRWAAAALVVLFAAAGVTAWVLTERATTTPQAKEFPDLISGGSGDTDLPVGRTFYADASPEERTTRRRVLVVRSITPNVVTNTAHSRVGVVICRRKSHYEGAGNAFRSDLLEHCRTLTAFRPERLDLRDSYTQVFYAITPRRAGVTEIRGCRIRYRYRTRSGDQVAGVTVVVTTRHELPAQ